MRLKHLFISEYKNLRDFKLNFEDDNFLDIFVGKNGTGKSNLFEALIKIFHHLHEFGTANAECDFNYKITYEIDTRSTSIEWRNSQLKINNRRRTTLGRTPVPDNILVYYSGHNSTVKQLIQKYETSFQSRIRGANFSDNRYFLGIGPDYKEILLASILLKPETSLSRQFICQKLGIQHTGSDVKITLKRPYYARRNSTFDVLSNDYDDDSRFWKAEGITKEFLDSLVTHRYVPQDRRIMTEGFLAGEDKYILYVDGAALAAAYAELPPHALFNSFDNLKVLDMLEDISIPLKLNNGEDAITSFFSDGQFQSVYIYAITELFKQRQCLTLLDEPDSFLHPQWQHEFLSQVFEISDEATQTNHTLLSTHSASTISSNSESLINLFEIDGNTVSVTKTPKPLVINSLSAGLISFSEREARLNIQHVLTSSIKAVLFTEGITDKYILEEAWRKLYPGETCPFEIQNAFGHDFLGKLLRQDDIYRDFPDRQFFGLFDFDSAYNTWKGINRNGLIEDDPRKCLTRKRNASEGYGLLLPVSDNLSIREQIINTTGNVTYKDQSLLTIELLFHDVAGLEAHFDDDRERPGNFRRFVGCKTAFATEVVPHLNRENFQLFTPIFDFINSKCNQQVELVTN